ncbi:hypothetical protein ACHAW5_003227 [Stephanodiscus triporus]|uniref:Uncharacterized protein n=1 Tax=Stephanodiscus triporus TaxID=2934178 RepID=A0ABD3QY43_9STRA
MSEKGESDTGEEIELQINNVTMNANGSAAAFTMERGLIQAQAISGSYHCHQDATHSLLYNPPIQPQVIDGSYHCVGRTPHPIHSLFYNPPTQTIEDPRTKSISSRIGGNLETGLSSNFSSAAMMAQRQYYHSHNDFDQALSQYGFGYPCFEPSSTTHRLNPTRDVSHAPEANVQFTTQSPFHANNFATYGRVIDIFNQGLGAGTDYSMAMQHSPSLYNLGTHGSAEWKRGYESNSSFPTVSYADQSSTPSEHSSLSTSLSKPPARDPSPSSNNGNIHHVCSLAVPSDSVFLDPAHIFLRSSCIEVFTTTVDDMVNPGRGARASNVGQVGLRCTWCKNLTRTQLPTQAICYPTKRVTIFESVRNYQRKHIALCPGLPQELKEKFKEWSYANVQNNKSQKMLRAYYAEAASDLGLIDTPKGLMFGAQPTGGIPSKNLLAIIKVAHSHPTASYDLLKKYKASSSKDKSLDLGKFEHLASERTREVIRKSRIDESALVFPYDFPKVGDAEFILYKQVVPFKPTNEVMNRIMVRRRIRQKEYLYSHPGLCCKYCARVHGIESYHNGMFFPTNRTMLTEFAFTQSLRNHILECCNVPKEVKNALEELKRLASEHCVVTKRGSKKNFLEKIWERMQKYSGE